MRALYISRHRILSEHVCGFFRDAGIDTSAAVGMMAGAEAARATRPDVVFCDYELLLAGPSRMWSADPELAALRLIAVSLTRRLDETTFASDHQVVDYLYLPALTGERLGRAIGAAAGRPAPRPVPPPRWRMSDRPVTETHR